MKNRLPVFLDKCKVCIICEGDEEYDYLERLREINVWNDIYKVSLDNAGGNGNIPARYQDRYQNTTVNYKDMYERVKRMESNDFVSGSTNFDRLVEYLATNDTTWIDEINSFLEM